MPQYDKIAKFYDATMGDRTGVITLLEKSIRRYHPRAKKILEIACGTGAILQGLSKSYNVSGIDTSRRMLGVAKRHLPNGTLYRQDMSEFFVPEKFDVILCVFDSINHLLTFKDWKRTFIRVRDHLKSGGLFIFDINTQKKLTRLATKPPKVISFGKNVMIMNIANAAKGITNWNITVFEHTRGNVYSRFEDVIKEISFPRKKIVQALRSLFASVIVYDAQKQNQTKRGNRLYFMCKKLPRA